jgi:hypothetical protein
LIWHFFFAKYDGSVTIPRAQVAALCATLSIAITPEADVPNFSAQEDID